MPTKPELTLSEPDLVLLRAAAERLGTNLDLEGATTSELAVELDERAVAVMGTLEALGRKPRPEGAQGLLIQALAAAQAAFPTIAKTKTATVRSDKGNYSYAYADLADVLVAVRPVLAEQGLAIVQRTVYLDNGRLMLVTTLHHVSGASLTSDVLLEANPSSPQAFGGALTYLRRYELVTLLGIQADEDADAHNTVAPEDRRDAPTTPAAELPKWSLEASDDRKAALLVALEPLLGKDGAIGLAQGAKASLGYVPDVLVAFARSLRQAMDAAAGVAGAEADAVRHAQDSAAARPDAPAPEPGPDPEPAEEPTGVDEAYLAGRPTDELVGTAEHHPRADVRAMAAAELERRGRVPAEEDGPPPEPGSIRVPELPRDPAQAFGVLRAAGCICADPLRQRSESGDFEQACPIDGHGVPF